MELSETKYLLGTLPAISFVENMVFHAAASYFGALRDIPVLWLKMDLPRIAEHWRTIGSRQSPLSGGPRLAITPFHGVLNYCFALLESETRLALTAVGLDPGLGFGLHTDTGSRDSLALDVLEPVRPEVESWLVSWIMREPFRRADFFETATGNCRLMAHLCARLSETAPTWGRLVAPWAEYVTRSLWASTSRSRAGRSLPTPLTQQRRREAKGRPSFPKVEPPRPDRLCWGCGKQVRPDKRLCSDCALTATRENFDAGRKSAQQPEFLAKRASTMQRHKQAIQNWNPSDLPAWLTEECYAREIQPRLGKLKVRRIAQSLRVSQPYAAFIRSGRRRPHPRHWLVLAGLVGVLRTAEETSANFNPS